ncbi:peptide chain release factor 2 [Candidatus Peregrinibacteria bacterium]|jgi:peptide chain release factor 2|nr:peptide chain release factor 2 [Candidatus Peregrinibacteria bacterium]MBT4631777.1 peptide chain release factor 2 [Candidatus Peregrinibacteria bacterium]MBT5516840.1 peptide chain release factor 2 [Candidatus Peregrinibacteria bacterium]MBT5824498.1 peptide chain release factor 2 [Candidatus Peregrinibacteria bacterium]
MQEIKEKLTLLSEEAKKSIESLDLPSKKEKLTELEGQMSAEGFWDDQSHAQKISRDAGHLRNTIDAWEKLQKDVQDLIELTEMIDPATDADSFAQLQKDVDLAEKQHDKLNIELYMSGPHDSSEAVITFHAGTGGTDASDFAEMLMRMYLRFCEKREWKTEQISLSPGSEAGIKSASFKVQGPFAYGYLKHENGVHRLVRLSPFNSGGTRETSFAMVEIVPEVEESALEIKDEDIKWDVFRAGGAGGQSVNTADSAVRLTHKSSGLVVTCQNERSQLQNKQSAMKTLKAKLIALQEKHHLETVAEIRGEHTQHSWGNQIRSYVLHPYQMVKDHRTNYESNQVEKVLSGDLDEFIEASLRQNPGKK